MSRTLRIAAMVTALLVPTRAWAHAHLKHSEPASGARLAAAPNAIRLWFSEQPELSVTFASLTDAAGRTFPLGPARREPSGQMGIAFDVLGAVPAGQYTVSWRTAASDGHPSSGKFTFTVVAAAPMNATAIAHKEITPDEGDADGASSIGNSIARGLLFVGLLALIGAISFKLLVLRGARAVPIELKEKMSRGVAMLGLVSATIVIVVSLVRLYLESQMMSAMPDMPGMRGMGAREMLMQTDWGFALRSTLASAVAALVGFAMAITRVRGGWFVATSGALVLAITPALGGHAAASPRYASLMITADWLHVLGGASWLGSLLSLMLIGVPIALTLEPADRWPSVASLVNAFSPLALVSAGVVVVSGVFASWVHLEHLSALWETAYGQILIVKLLLVGITLTIGAYNFRRVQPQLSNQIGTERLRKSAAAELATALAILMVTGLLTGISP